MLVEIIEEKSTIIINTDLMQICRKDVGDTAVVHLREYGTCYTMVPYDAFSNVIRQKYNSVTITNKEGKWYISNVIK